MFRLLNNKGSSYVSLLVSIIVLLSIVSMVFSFNSYFVDHSKSVKINNEVSQIINNKIADTYNLNEWDNIDSEAVKTTYDELQIIYTYEGMTEFGTEKLNISFHLNDNYETYNLERSVYHE